MQTVLTMHVIHEQTFLSWDLRQISSSRVTTTVTYLTDAIDSEVIVKSVK